MRRRPTIPILKTVSAEPIEDGTTCVLPVVRRLKTRHMKSIPPTFTGVEVPSDQAREWWAWKFPMLEPTRLDDEMESDTSWMRFPRICLMPSSNA